MAEGALLRSDPPFSAVFDNTPDIVVRFDRELRHLYVNDAVARATGRPKEQFLGRTNRELGMPEHLCELWERELLPVLETGEPNAFDFDFETPDGPRTFEARVEPELAPDGSVSALVSVGRDVTAVRAAQAQIAFHASLLEQVRNAVIATDAEGRITYWNGAAERMYGWSREEVLGRSIVEVTVPVGAQDIAAEILESMAVSGHWAGEFDVRRKDGTVFPAQVTNTLLRAADGTPTGAVGVSSDLTDRRATEAARRESEERFRQLADHVDAVFWLADPETRTFDYLSPAVERIWGLSRHGLRTEADFLETVHEDDREALAARVGRRLEAFEEEYRVRRGDGTTAWIRDRGFPIRDAAGRIVRVAGLAVDVTEQRALEEQLRQSQKMEAVGKLTGGIAHDFNNLLTAINGYCDSVAAALPASAPPRVAHGVREIRRAGQRAAELTQQLLAFSRQQMLHPEVLELNAVVENYASMLERLLGEDVTLVLATSVDAGRVRVDPGQLGQVIMNLAVNARDAMQDGGTLTIETRRLQPDDERPPSLPAGDYVRLTVGDSGCGMEPEVLARVFEPFFTTKEQGRGTGLGLPTILGIVEQSGGAVTVHSAPGAGTTFHVVLPRVEMQAEAAAPAPAAVAAGGGTILLVEDEEIVRSLVAEILHEAGYDVVEASGPREALRLADGRERIDLLLTDVVMPEMNGRELATRLVEARPGLRVLFTSGYTGDVVTRRGVLDGGEAFLQKPFSADELLAKVAELAVPPA